MKNGVKIKDWLKRNKCYLYCLYLPIYLLMFFIVEQVINNESNYWVSYLATDDLIPFVDWFVIFYFLWYPTLFGIGIWLIFKDKPAFERYMFMIMTGFSISIIVFYIFPNGQNLRVTNTGDTIFSKVITYLYSIDTNTNVLPSIHAYAGIIAMTAIIDTNSIKGLWIKVLISTSCILSAMSTVFIKQHSILDVYAAIVMFIPLLLIIYRKQIFTKRGSHKLAFMSPITLPSEINELAEETVNIPEDKETASTTTSVVLPDETEQKNIDEEK